MKKIITILLSMCCLTALAQVPEYSPYRTPLAGKTPYQVVDSALSARQLRIPAFTTNSLNGYADFIGQSFGLNKIDTTLSVRILSGYANFPAKPWIVNQINNRIPYLTAGSVYFAGTGGAPTQDNTNLNWDNTNKILTAKIVTVTNTTPGTTASPNYININFNGFSSRPKASIRATEKSSSSNLSGLTFLTADASTVLQPRAYLDEGRFAFVNSSGTFRRAMVTTDAPPANASIAVANGTDWNTVAMSGAITIDNTGLTTYSIVPVAKGGLQNNVTPLNNQILVGSSSVYTPVTVSGDITNLLGVFSLATVNANVGSFTSANITVDAKGRITAASNGTGPTLSGNNTFTGNNTFKNFYSTSAAPTATVGGGAGVGATVSVVGTNQDGIITLTTGTGTINGTLFTVTMSGSFAYPTSCAAALTLTGTIPTTYPNIAVTTQNATTFTVGCNVAGGLAASTTYTWNYHNGGY